MILAASARTGIEAERAERSGPWRKALGKNAARLIAQIGIGDAELLVEDGGLARLLRVDLHVFGFDEDLERGREIMMRHDVGCVLRDTGIEMAREQQCRAEVANKVGATLRPQIAREIALHEGAAGI